MILLTQGISGNTFNITISQPILPTQYMRMTFESSFSAGNTYIVFPTIVESNARYTEFNIDCSETSPDPLQGQINFLPTGTYTYVLDKADSLSIGATSAGVLLADTATVLSCSNPSKNIYNFITVNNAPL